MGAAQPAADAPESATDPAATKTCISAYEAVQNLRRDGRMRAAKEKAIACARSECPESLAKDCASWLDELKLSTPTVVFDARDQSGQFQRAVKIYLDDELVTEELDGRAVEVDPGARTLRAETAGFPPLEKQIVIQQGQKNHKIALTLVKPEATQKARPVPLASWIFGGVGIAGLVVGGVFTGMGLSAKGDLDTCKPSCPADEVDGMMRDLAIGDVAFVAGLVSGAAALTIYLTRPEIAEVVSEDVAVSFGVGPTGAALRLDF